MGLIRRLTIIALAGVIIIIVVIDIISTRGQKIQLPSTGAQATTPSVGNPLVVAAITPTRSNYLPFVYGAIPTNTPTPTFTPPPNPGGSGEWNQLGGNAQHTSYISATIPLPWKVKWIWNGPIGGGDAGPASDHLALPRDVQPVVGDGMLFIGHSDGYLRAISQATGKQVWSVKLGSAITNTAAYDSDTQSVYIATTDGSFWHVGAASGQVIRSLQLGSQIKMAPLLVGNTVYIGSLDGKLYAFDKITLNQKWSYNAGAPLVATPAYSPNHGGLIILEVEDKSVQAVHVSDGTRSWRVTVPGEVNPDTHSAFPDAFPVVANDNDVVIVRSYMLWDDLWQPTGGAPSTVSEIRDYLTQNPTLQSFFVLSLVDGSSRYVAPVMGGGVADPTVMQSVPPQAIIKLFPDGKEFAYLLWRTRQACIRGFCDGREDTTLGEMDLTTGNIRFVQDHKNQGVMRLPGDEQSPLSMAGDTLLYSHWMMLGTLQIINRSSSLGGTYTNPIATTQLTPALNTLTVGSCGNRSNHSCPASMYPPCDTSLVNPGFYTYYSSNCVYDQFFSTPVRSAVVSDGTIYWRSVDGAIMAIESAK
jgi:outer membrane protein assembly factor BamB